MFAPAINEGEAKCKHAVVQTALGLAFTMPQIHCMRTPMLHCGSRLLL